MQKLEISIDEWRRLTEDGAKIPVQIPLNGVSMQPLIRRLRDIVTIMPYTRKPLIGDVVLFRRSDGAYVVHRIKKIFDSSVQTLGDNCITLDSPMPIKSVLGIVTHIKRGKHTFCIDSKFFRFSGRVWMWILPIRKIFRKCVTTLKKCVKRLLGRECK